MAGIISYGAYVPLRRIGPGTRGWSAGTEKAVANFDEDSLTMAVAAATDCLTGIDRKEIEGLYFATTTPPYGEKLAATTAAWALGLRQDIRTADITDSLRAGTGALRMATDAIKANPDDKILVTAADLRTGTGNMNNSLGDGAAALLVGEGNEIATVDGVHSLNNELFDVWRAAGSKTVRSWEDRFVFEEGYLKILPEAVNNFLKKSGLDIRDINKVVFYGPDLRRHRQMAGILKLKPEQVPDPLFGKLGNTGTSFCFMQLVGALEEANPGDTILLASYGDGADVILLKITDRIRDIGAKWGIKRSLDSKMILRDIADYHAYRELVNVDPEKFAGASASVIARERDAIYTLNGVKCLNCGTPQYPPQRICTQCHTQDNYEPYNFADKRGKVFTFTLKYGGDIPAFARPGVDTMVDFEGGGRAIFGMTDVITEDIKVGMEVEMCFRKLGTGGGIHNYAWRCRPPRDSWLNKEAG